MKKNVAIKKAPMKAGRHPPGKKRRTAAAGVNGAASGWRLGAAKRKGSRPGEINLSQEQLVELAKQCKPDRSWYGEKDPFEG